MQLSEWRDYLQKGKQYMPTIYSTEYWYPEYKKCLRTVLCKWVIQFTTGLKIWKDTYQKKKYNDQKVCEKEA